MCWINIETEFLRTSGKVWTLNTFLFLGSKRWSGQTWWHWKIWIMCKYQTSNINHQSVLCSVFSKFKLYSMKNWRNIEQIVWIDNKAPFRPVQYQPWCNSSNIFQHQANITQRNVQTNTLDGFEQALIKLSERFFIPYFLKFKFIFLKGRRRRCRCNRTSGNSRNASKVIF
jgi:hypothetical protein